MATPKYMKLIIFDINDGSELWYFVDSFYLAIRM